MAPVDWERVKKALVFAMEEAGEQGGNLKAQYQQMFGFDIEEAELLEIARRADKLNEAITMGTVFSGGHPTGALLMGSAAVFMAGMAVGKRLGVEDADEFYEAIGTDISTTGDTQ